MPADRADCGLVADVDIGALIAIHFHGDEMLVHDGRHFGIVVRLAIHHMAPVAPHRANVEEHRLVFPLRGSERLLAPFVPTNWLVHGFFLFFLNALLRGVLGYLLLRHPLAGAAGVTLVLGSFFVVGGLFRIVGASVLRFPSWGWAVLSGFVSLVLGVVVLAHMPVMSVFFLGIVVGVDLLTDGIAFVALGTQLHSIPKIEPYKASKAA